MTPLRRAQRPGTLLMKSQDNVGTNRLRRAADSGDPLACLGDVGAAVMRPHVDRRRGSAGGVKAPRGPTSPVRLDGACVS